MAIRDRFRRALRKSDSSDSASDSNTATTTASTLSRVFTFGSRDKNSGRQKDRERDEKKINSGSRSRGARKPMHPSQRPLTLQNIRHQELLSHFTMTFGASDPTQIESLSFCGVSPCCTRPPSIDLDRGVGKRDSETPSLRRGD